MFFKIYRDYFRLGVRNVGKVVALHSKKDCFQENRPVKRENKPHLIPRHPCSAAKKRRDNGDGHDDRILFGIVIPYNPRCLPF